MRFRAKVVTAAMAVEVVEVDASSNDEARRIIESSGRKLLTLTRIRTGVIRSAQAPSSFNLAVFNQQLFSLLEAGQTIVDSIDILGRNDKRGRHRGVYDTLLGTLKEGNQLSDAMSALPSIFPPLYIAMVKSSETTGTVRASIERYIRYQGQVARIRRKLIAAAIYPAILVTVGLTVIAFLMLYVVPRFSAVFDDVSASQHAAPGFVQLWGTFVRNNTSIAWSSLVVAVAALIMLVLHPAPRQALLKRLLRIPLIGEKVWILHLARLYRTLGMLLRSGVSVLAAMRMTGDSLSIAMRENMRRATVAVGEGMPLSTVMPQCGLSTEISQRLLLAGESSGNLDEMMERIADFYDQEMAIWIDTAGRLIEPILMIAIGLVIGIVVLMLYMPIFDLANVV